MAALRNGTVVPQEFLTVYCEEYGQVRLSDKLISNVLILATSGFILYSSVVMFLQRKHSPFRQRAPLLAIYHSLLYLMLIIIPMWPAWINTDSWSADSNGNLINSTNEIPFSRRLLKFLLTFTRLMVMWMIPFRVIAIWCQWKYKDYKNTKWKLVFQVFCSQKWSMVVATTLNLLLVVFAFNYGGELPLSKPALDWYDQRPNFWRRNRWFNTTIIRIFEAVMGVGFLWMIRRFPKNLRLFSEYACIMWITFLISWYFELVGPIGKVFNYQSGFKNACSLFQIRVDFLGDMIRSMAYSVAIFWFARTKTERRLPCVYINNLELFLQDIECKRLFRKYLISRGGHAKMLDLTASMMEASMEGTEDFLASEDNSRLHSHFQEFQQTKSFKYLAREIQIAEQVEALSFETR